jgi:IS605 OrfB family transposase
MMRVKKNVLRLNKEQYKFLRYLSRNSKHLYNATVYAIRQHYFNCGKHLDYYSAQDLLKKSDCFQALPSDPAQQTMKVVDRNFKSFFSLLWKKKQGHYNSPVRLPGYLPKDGYFPVIFPCRAGRMATYFRTMVPKELQEKFGFNQIIIPRPEQLLGKTLKEVRLIPKLDYFEIEWVYEEEQEIKPLEKDRVLGIDVGVSNFATCVDSQSGRSFILDGRELKSYNRYFNKRVATMKPKSRNKQRLFDKRWRMLNNALNQYVNFVVQYCIENKVGKVVVGEGYMAPKNHGRVNNQNFANLPFGRFCQKLQAKCEKYGIEFSTTEESYTSKVDHLAGESMEHHEQYMGKRVHRGLFKSSTGIILNADVNGGLGMIRKSNHEIAVKQLVASGCLTQPRRIRLGEIQSCSSIQLVKRLAA